MSNSKNICGKIGELVATIFVACIAACLSACAIALAVRFITWLF